MKLKCILFVFLLFSSSVVQANSLVTPWSDGSSVTFLGNDRWKTVHTSIEYSTNHGTKMLVFHLVPSDLNQRCQLNYDDNETDITFVVDGQAIRGGVRCGKFTNSGEIYYDIWAYTGNGINYMVDRFRRSPSKVSISTPLIDFDVSAIGFTAEWNRTGGNAL